MVPALMRSPALATGMEPACAIPDHAPLRDTEVLGWDRALMSPARAAARCSEHQKSRYLPPLFRRA